MLEAVINVSEGRDRLVLAAIAESAGRGLLDVHSDRHHHRSVLTVVGEDAARAVARAAVDRIDLRHHDGVHPRIGAVDVVPFVALGTAGAHEAVAARDRFAAWAAAELGLPCFLYGPERTLPSVRRDAFRTLAPDVGPARPHPSAGAVAVGARPLLVAYNVWLASADLEQARALAVALRGPAVRALGLPVGDRVQVSMNLIDPATVGPAEVVDRIAAQVAIERTELVGLAPAALLDATPATRWRELDLDPDRTIEARLERAGWPHPT
ncbi:MAG: Formiminotransferase domain protein [Acidimicrobiales bacterium]|nr:Formiminotransferase domain protein [Acidimicrobiales bacterium]